jgi:hypothetical protein
MRIKVCVVVIAAALMILAAVGPANAAAAPDAYGHDIGGSLPSHVEGENTVVHYSTRASHGESAITDEMAAQVLAATERSYAALRALGLPAQLSDADGKVDFYIYEWPIASGDAITKSDDPAAPRATSFVKVDAASYLKQIQNSVDYLENVEAMAAHELAHVIQDSLAQYQGQSPDMRMLAEGTAEAAALRAVGPGGPVFSGPAIGASLNEVGGAYQSWMFFESVVQDVGIDAIPGMYAEIGAGREPLDAIGAMLAARGGSLAAAYSTFASRYATGSWTSEAAARNRLVTPRENARKLPRKAPEETVKLKSVKVTLDHLATTLAEYGPGRAGKKCDRGKLAIAVTLPPGMPAPWLVTRTGADDAPPTAIAPMSVKGTKASISRRWLPCRDIATIVLANGSATADGQRFTVTAKFKP